MLYIDVIKEAKDEFLQNTWSFIYWGVVGIFVPTIILVLKNYDNGIFKEYSNYPIIIFPLSGLFTTFIIVRHSLKHRSVNPVSIVLSFLWGIASINVIVIAFGFPVLFGKLLVGTVFLLLGMAQSTCGLLLKIKSLAICGILMIGLVWIYLILMGYSKTLGFLGKDLDLILLMLVSLFGQLIPGYLLIKK